jgi:hypothetical protein
MLVIRTVGSARIAELLHLLRQGECIAHDGARRQALICGDARMKRFFALQATHEMLHAGVLDVACSVLSPRHRAQSPALTALAAFRRDLEHDLARGHLAASIVGLQIVLEGLGMLTLSRMNPALSRHGARFAPFKRVLEQQEHTHHAFGCRWLERQDRSLLPQRAADARRYFDLAAAVIDDGADLFCHGASTPRSYKQGLLAALPPALTQGWAP